MSITTYNTAYFDDLSVSDLNQKTPLDKNYLRILFKPGYSVQVRELNQLQSIIQNQIDRLGSSIYREGSAIHGGNCSFDAKIKTVDVLLDSTYFENRLANVTHLRDDLGLIASIYGYEVISSEGTQTKTVRFYIRYNNTILDSEGNNVNAFPQDYPGNSGTQITNRVVEYDEEENDSDFTIGDIVATGYCAGLFLSEGIFFVKGSFAYTPAQSKFFAYSLNEEQVKNTIDGYACIVYREVVVNYSMDETLLDNANGTPNYSAPGADRYSIDLNLEFATESEFANITNSIKLLSIRNSLVIDSTKSKYTAFDQIMAQRTFEESGNYTVSPFNISVREFYNDLTNGGRYVDSGIPIDDYDPDKIYSIGDMVKYNDEFFYRKKLKSSNIVDTPSSSSEYWDLIEAKDLYHVSLDRGVAYVGGYRIETIDNQELYVPKARGSSHVSKPANIASSAGVGQYVTGSFSSTSPLPAVQNTTYTYNLKNGAAVIGSCRIRAIESAGSDKYALFLYDIDMTGTNVFSSTTAIENTNFDPDFLFTLDSTAIYDAQNSSAIFKLPYSVIQNVSNLEYYVLRTLNLTQNFDYTLEAEDETFADSSNTIVRLANGTKAVTSGILSTDAKTITFNPVNGQNVTSACLRIKISSSNTTSRLKTKTLTLNTQTNLSPYSPSLYRLEYSDLVRIVTVTTAADSIDVTDFCTIVSDGQHPAKYSNAIIKYNGSSLGVNADLNITYEYLHHSEGDYFTVNSYGSLDYEDIPSFNDIRLSDVYDFRPLILENGSSSQNVSVIDPNSVFEANISYYLSRKDSISVNPSGIFTINRGAASLSPIEPQAESDSMLLYKLDIPAYTFSTSDITITPVDNRRYTMRDIGKLAGRIDTLEYYTALSQLEKNAMDRRILDIDATDRLKNGIVVDAFYNHAIGNVSNEGYACAVDTVDGGLSPKQLAKSVPLKTIENLKNNIVEHKRSITLNYTEQPLITQLRASETISVNPYDVAIFTGDLLLMPSTDDWKDTENAPLITINDTGAYDAMLIASQRDPNIFGTTKNEWSKSWTVKTRYEKGDYDPNRPRGQRRAKTPIISIKQTGTQTTYSLGSSTTQTVSENIIDSGYIPYIRSRKIYFSATGLKPNTRVYAFFDDIDVTDYCNRLNSLPTEAYNEIDDSDVDSYNNITSSDNRFFKRLPLKADSSGKISGEFIIPNNSIVRFKTGERSFVLTSSPRNIATEAETTARASYIASGTTLTVQKTITSITRPELITTVKAISRTIEKRGDVEYYDPLAQTFLISDIDEGVFVTSVEIFFAKKSANKPVTLQIVTVENGIPTQNRVPYSRVVVDAENVNIDPNKGLAPTEFRFSDPIYLKKGVEYAIVLLSNDSAYRVWIASLGGKDVVDNTIISKNVYNGVFLTSQNASTWTPDQNKDLKFNLKRAQFDSYGSITHRSRLRGRIERIEIDVDNTGALLNGSGYTTAPAVIIAPPGATATATAVVKSGSVTSFTSLVGGSNYNSRPVVTISAPNNPSGIQAKAKAFINSSGAVYKISTELSDGGDPGSGYDSAPTVTVAPPGITATASASIDPISNVVTAIKIETPGSNYRTAPAVTIAAPTGGGGVTAEATAIVEEIDFTGFNLNQTVLIPEKTSIVNRVVNTGNTYENVRLNNDYNLEEQYTVSRTNQISVVNELKSESSYVSPVLHIERRSIVCFKNIINDLPPIIVDDIAQPDTSEIERDAGNAAARYITKQITLNNSSDKLNIYIDINRPSIQTDVELYVKFDDSTTWKKITPLTQIPVSSDENSYTEVQYITTDDDNEFTKFAIKIVMLSSNPALVPTLRDLRAIATI